MICRLASPDSALPELSGDERMTTEGESKEESNVRVFDGGGGPQTFWLTRINGDMQEITYPPVAASPQRSVIVSESQSQTEGDDNAAVESDSARRGEMRGEMSAFWANATGGAGLCRVNGDTAQEFLMDKAAPAAPSVSESEDSKVRVKEESVFDNREVVPHVGSATVTSSPPALWLTAGATPGCRINGVMPELIGGGLNYPETLKRQEASSPQRTGAVRAAPTVIMGEAGGVRTMIWSQPSAEPPQTTPGPASSSWSNSEESAAQLLLNLGQARAPALNMERLWAGDLSQLPASHQALNLSWPPAPWLRNGEPARQEEAEDDDQPMVCMICEDKATGLHYGIITCEG